jgi:periplasmic protein TonB
MTAGAEAQVMLRRLCALILAIGLHAAILSAALRSAGYSLDEGKGSGQLNVVAAINLESADLFTQTAQEAAPAIKAKAAEETEPPPPQQIEQSKNIPEPEKAQLPDPPRADVQKTTVTETAGAPVEIFAELRAAQAEAARQSVLWSRYRTALYSALERHKVHVAQSGDVLLQVTLAPTGRVIERRLVRSSGIAEIDRAAIAALDRSSPFFPPVPPEVSSGPVTLTVPFEFRTR